MTAIANYTQRVVDTSLSATQRQEALKFIDHVRPSVLVPSESFRYLQNALTYTLYTPNLLTYYSPVSVRTKSTNTNTLRALERTVQFLGDIGQPLHVEAFEVGGNDIDAICGGDKTNLHAVSSPSFFSLLVKVILIFAEKQNQIE